MYLNAWTAVFVCIHAHTFNMYICMYARVGEGGMNILKTLLMHVARETCEIGLTERCCSGRDNGLHK